jgi:hypothetical protein
MHSVPIVDKAAPMMHTSPPSGKEVAWAFFLPTGVQDIVFIDNLRRIEDDIIKWRLNARTSFKMLVDLVNVDRYAVS